MSREQIPLRLESALLAKLNRATRDVGKSRNEFTTQAIERALDGETADFTAGYRVGFDRMLERTMRDMRCYQEALILVRDGMDITPALRQVFEEAEKET